MSGETRSRLVRLLRSLAAETSDLDAADLRALAAELERGPVVVQTSVLAQGMSASLSLDAIGPVSLARRVFVASPYAGDVEGNEAYARACMSDSLARDEAPFVPHLLYTQVLPEDGGAGRRRGLDAAKTMLAGCDLLAVYEDRGVSSGMAGEIEHAALLGIPVERRRIGSHKAFPGTKGA